MLGDLDFRVGLIACALLSILRFFGIIDLNWIIIITSLIWAPCLEIIIATVFCYLFYR